MAFISKNIEKLINFRIQREEASSRLYLAMSKWLGYNGYSGAEKLWAKYSSEELNHAGWGYTYLQDLDLLPCVPQLEQPVCEYKSLPDIIQQSYDHEMLISKECNDLAKASFNESDFMTLQLAQKYLAEQSEEISKITYWLDRLDAFGDSKEALRLLDDEMGE